MVVVVVADGGDRISFSFYLSFYTLGR